MVNKARNFMIILKNLICNRCTQNFFKCVIQKTAEATGDLISNKIANKITKHILKIFKNNSKTVANEHDKEIPKEKYVSPEERQETLAKLRLKQYNNVISKNS